MFSTLWTSLSVYVSLTWLEDFSKVITFPVAIIIICGIAYLPGYLNAFLVASLILDRQPPFKDIYPSKNITVLIAARNKGDRIAGNINYIAKQDYTGRISRFNTCKEQQACLSYAILYTYQVYVFRHLKLKARKNIWGFILFVLFYQMLMSPVSVWGYLQEFLKLDRVWK
ncbi:MAG: hypothetical protein ACYCYE_01155 [Clostridia bacterium]